jgi:hypothetical protein
LTLVGGRPRGEKDAINVVGGPTGLFEYIRTVGHNASARTITALRVNRGKSVLRRQSDDQIAMGDGDRAARSHD